MMKLLVIISILFINSGAAAPGVSDSEQAHPSKERYNLGISIVGGNGPRPANEIVIDSGRYPPGGAGYPIRDKYPARNPYPNGDRNRYPGGRPGGDRDRYPGGHPGGDRDRYPGGHPGGDRDRYPGGHPGGDRDRYPGGQPGGDRDRYPGGHPGGDRDRYPPGGHYPDNQGHGDTDGYPEHDYVTFFEQPYFRGWRFNAKLSRQCRNLENDYGSYNKGISSIKTHGNCVVVFTRFDCRGREYIIRPNYGNGPLRQGQGQNRYRPTIGHSELAEDLNNSISSYRRC